MATLTTKLLVWRKWLRSPARWAGSSSELSGHLGRKPCFPVRMSHSLWGKLGFLEGGKEAGMTSLKVGCDAKGAERLGGAGCTWPP